MNRVFTILDYPGEGKEWGRFESSTPLGAAHHAFRALATEMGFVDTEDGQKYLIFTIREAIPNKRGRDYIGTWVQLHKPVQIENGEYIRRRPVVTNWYQDLKETFLPIQ